MVLKVDLANNRIVGTVQSVRDIRELGLFKASLRHQPRGLPQSLDITNWSQLFTADEGEDDWKPDPNAEEDEEW